MFKDLFPSLGFCPFHALLWLFKCIFVFRFIKFFEIFIRSLWGHFVTKPLDLEPYKKYWTVMTGCTDGIGRAYLEELVATRGIRKLYLIGRNLAKLDELSTFLAEKYDGCEIKTAIFDFENDDLDQLPGELKTLDIGILINCAGIAPDRIANFVELPPGTPSRILRVNLLSCVKMTEMVLPGMVQRNLGIIVNFSSITGWRPLPYMSTYPASKAAIGFFSDSIADEFAHTKLKIQCLFPSLVATKMASYAPSETNLLVVDTKSFARQSVNIIGNYRVSTGCFNHDMQAALGVLISFKLFKLLYVPFGILRYHQKRVEAYRNRTNNEGDGKKAR